jgi:hypothetical protein
MAFGMSAQAHATTRQRIGHALEIAVKSIQVQQQDRCLNGTNGVP